MNRTNSSEEERPVYALRMREYAVRDMNAATVRFAELASDDIAIAWKDGLMQAIGSLATLPRRFPRAPERFQGEVRKMPYSRSDSSVKYYVFYTITGEEEGSLEPPTVAIIHVRHGAAHPLTRAQIRQIEAEE